MANITVGASFGLNMRSIDFSYIYDAWSYTATSTLFRADYGYGYADEFRGSGFKYNSYGEPTAGTVKSYAAYVEGERALILDGTSISASSIVKAARTYSTSDDQAVLASALSGNDTFKGGNLGDFIKTYAGNDTILGNGGVDGIYAGAGNDHITGGIGRDKLYGESGSDTFIFKSLSDSTVESAGRDIIYDFTSADTIHLSTIDANTNATGDQAFSFISTKAFSGKAGELRFDKKSSDTYVYGDVNGDKVADFAIHLDDAYSFTKGDFIL